MALVRLCDCCRIPDNFANPVAVPIMKTPQTGTNRPKQVIEAKMDLCETCLTNFLSAFGRFKTAWLSSGGANLKMEPARGKAKEDHSPVLPAETNPEGTPAGTHDGNAVPRLAG